MILLDGLTIASPLANSQEWLAEMIATKWSLMIRYVFNFNTDLKYSNQQYLVSCFALLVNDSMICTTQKWAPYPSTEIWDTMAAPASRAWPARGLRWKFPTSRHVPWRQCGHILRGPWNIMVLQWGAIAFSFPAPQNTSPWWPTTQSQTPISWICSINPISFKPVTQELSTQLVSPGRFPKGISSNKNMTPTIQSTQRPGRGIALPWVNVVFQKFARH